MFVVHICNINIFVLALQVLTHQELRVMLVQEAILLRFLKHPAAQVCHYQNFKSKYGITNFAISMPSWNICFC